MHPYASSRSFVFVGVHARRTDYKRHLKVLISGKLVTKKYFEDAMTFIKDKYRDGENYGQYEVRKITQIVDCNLKCSSTPVQ